MVMHHGNTTYWTFPPGLNDAFYRGWWEEIHKTNGTGGTATLILAVVHNLTLPERLAPGFTNTGFGSTGAIVRQGDVFEFSWQDTTTRTIYLNCDLCGTGAEGGAIENACANYTNTEHMNEFYNNTGPLLSGQRWTFPSFETYFGLRNETCAMCMFTLSDQEGYPESGEYTIPFPVLQQPGATTMLFNAMSPLGTPLPPVTSDKLNVGMIVGVVVGVMGGMAILVLAGWCFWRKRRTRTKVVDSSASSTADRPGPNATGMAREERPPAIPLQPVPGALHRPVTSASDVPPPYHEAIRAGETSRSVSPVSYREPIHQRNSRSVSPMREPRILHEAAHEENTRSVFPVEDPDKYAASYA